MGLEIPVEAYLGIGIMVLLNSFLIAGVGWEWIIEKWGDDWHDI